MGTTGLGGSRVGAVISTLSKHGFRCGRMSASGQRRGKRIEEDMIAGDVIALSAEADLLPHLLIEVGGASKRLGVAFRELRESILPGFAPMVVRFVARKRWYYVTEDDRFDAVEEALMALREA